jgi:formylmethanofuran dehydrogenase subunit C
MITLTLKADLQVPLEAEAIAPDNFVGKPASEIGRLHVTYGNEAAVLGDFFNVEGEASAEITLNGDLSRVKGIAAGMTRGVVTVNGNAGMHLGAGMRGGEIHAFGNAGDWAGRNGRRNNSHTGKCGTRTGRRLSRQSARNE